MRLHLRPLCVLAVEDRVVDRLDWIGELGGVHRRHRCCSCSSSLDCVARHAAEVDLVGEHQHLRVGVTPGVPGLSSRSQIFHWAELPAPASRWRGRRQKHRTWCCLSRARDRTRRRERSGQSSPRPGRCGDHVLDRPEAEQRGLAVGRRRRPVLTLVVDAWVLGRPQPANTADMLSPAAARS